MSLWDKANWGCKWFSFNWLRGVWRLGFGVGVGGLEALQVQDGLALQAAGVTDAALETGLGVGSVVECLADGAVGAGIVGVFDGVDEEFGIDPVEAAEAPGVTDDVIDQEAFDVGLGLATLVETCGEVGEIGDIFAGDDGGLGVDSGF
jgi:hypothetical protein